MRRYPADFEIYPTHGLVLCWACYLLTRLVPEPDAVQRVRDVGGGELVVSALRAHITDAEVAHASCSALCSMLVNGLASSIVVEAAASLAAAAHRTHPSDEDVQTSASSLAERLLEYCSTPLVDGASPECATLARVAELKGRHDFVSLVRDMNAIPQCEELQCDGCDAIYAILEDGGLREDAAAAGALECILRSLDLFPFSAGTQGKSLMTLARITFLEATVARAGNAGVVPLAVGALRTFPNNVLLIYNALTVLGNVSSDVQLRAEALNLNALAFGVAALRRYTLESHSHILLTWVFRHAKYESIADAACHCLSCLCLSEDATAADAARLGIMELALSALRVHRSDARVLYSASLLLRNLCFDEARAIKAKQLGAPEFLQAAKKAHPSVESVQMSASDALARIQHFLNAACARAEANMAELIAGEEAAKKGKGIAAALKKEGKGKGKKGEGIAAGFFPPPPPQEAHASPVAAGALPILTKTQIKRRKAKAADAARKVAAASGSTAAMEDEEEGSGSDVSSDDSEPFRPRRPPLDFSADGEFRRSMNLSRRPGIEAEIDKMVAESEARHAAKLAAAAAVSHALHDAMSETQGADTSGGAAAASSEPSALPFSSAAPRLEAAPSSISLHAPLVAEAAPVGASAVAAAAFLCDPLPSPLPLACPDPAASSARVAEPAAASPLSPSSQPSALHTTPPDVGCSLPSCAALTIENAALRADVAALRARVSALEADVLVLRG